MNKYKTVKGTYDILPRDVIKWQAIEDRIRQFCMLYNFKEIRTPIFEYTDVFKRDNDSSDVVNKEMYTFSIHDKDSLTLRPESTAGVVRSFVEHKLYGEGDLPAKLYYVGPQFRYEQPQKGRQRIFHQFGVEVIGAKNPTLDVEVIALGYSLVRSLGLQEVKILLNTLGDSESRIAYRDALSNYFSQYESEMCSDCKRRLIQNPLRILDCKVDHNHEWMKRAPKMEDYLNDTSKQYFESVKQALQTLEIPFDVDDRLVRGLDYYTDTVFEVISTSSSMGSQSTLFGGGRYDGLVSYFGGPDLSGIGFGIGIERILIALEGEGITIAQEEPLDVYVLCLHEDVSLLALEILTSLRANGYTCDRDYLQRSFKAQFRSVEKKQAKCAIILGEKDLQNGTLTIKEIETQQQHTVTIDALIDVMDQIFNREEEACSCGEACTCNE